MASGKINFLAHRFAHVSLVVSFSVSVFFSVTTVVVLCFCQYSRLSITRISESTCASQIIRPVLSIFKMVRTPPDLASVIFSRPSSMVARASSAFISAVALSFTVVDTSTACRTFALSVVVVSVVFSVVLVVVFVTFLAQPVARTKIVRNCRACFMV